MPDLRTSFRERSRQIFDLAQAQQALEWDQEVIMPPKGAGQRAEQLAALATVIHERITDPAYGELIARLEEDQGLDAATKADVREARRQRERAVRLPSRLVAERTLACATAQSVWVEAKPANDFARFLPHLERVVALTRQVAQAIGSANPYDALLDEYEPGMTEARLREVFTDLKARLVPLLESVRGAARRPDRTMLERHFPVSGQEAFCRRLVHDMGFDLEAGRFDISAHPFTNGTLRDVRLTTRYHEGYLPAAVFGTIHEAGHGLYEQGLDPERFRDPAGCACSMGIHESQSRMWENLIGRSRAFWSHYYPVLRGYLPGVLEDVPLDAFHRAVNAVSPSLIRIEADEATYNLHILLRFDLESELISGRLQAKDLPGAWAAKMREYLGIEPPDDRLGVLQDIHWAVGLIGYFPTYALGNLYGAQFLEALRAERPDLDDLLARGELEPIKAWLNEKIHRQGRRWPAHELCRRVTGKDLSPEPLMRHLKARCAEVYGV